MYLKIMVPKGLYDIGDRVVVQVSPRKHPQEEAITLGVVTKVYPSMQDRRMNWVEIAKPDTSVRRAA